jgi:hypothetical protein
MSELKILEGALPLWQGISTHEQQPSTKRGYCTPVLKIGQPTLVATMASSWCNLDSNSHIHYSRCQPPVNRFVKTQRIDLGGC